MILLSVEYVLGKSLGVCFLGSDFGSIFEGFQFYG